MSNGALLHLSGSYEIRQDCLEIWRNYFTNVTDEKVIENARGGIDRTAILFYCDDDDECPYFEELTHDFPELTICYAWADAPSRMVGEHYYDEGYRHTWAETIEDCEHIKYCRTCYEEECPAMDFSIWEEPWLMSGGVIADTCSNEIETS